MLHFPCQFFEFTIPHQDNEFPYIQIRPYKGELLLFYQQQCPISCVY